MKKMSSGMLVPMLFLLAALVSSCRPSRPVFETEMYNFADSTAHSHLSLNVELPVPGNAVSEAVRDALVEILDGSLSHLGSYEEERAFPPFPGANTHTDALMAYYQEQAMQRIGQLSREDFEDRELAIRENAELSAAEKTELLASAPSWEYELNLKELRRTDGYVVFASQDYIYMGGAHGGILGAGFPAFDRRDGHRVSPVLRPDCTEEIQPLLVRGLLQYFRDAEAEVSEEELPGMLLLEDEGRIPLPAWDPYPGEDGLVFTYQQYEIASYAAGMPSFVIPYAEVRGFLTPDACAVFGL